MPFPGGGNSIFEFRQAQRVNLCCNSGTTSAIYHCDITTVAVPDNNVRETVYVGLYSTDEGIRMHVHSNGVLVDTLCGDLFISPTVTIIATNESIKWQNPLHMCGLASI